VLFAVEENVEDASYEYCDDFEEYAPEQVTQQLLPFCVLLLYTLLLRGRFCRIFRRLL